MNIEIINNLLTNIGYVVFPTMIMSEIWLGIHVGKKFDQFFPEFVSDKDAVENGFWILSQFARGLRYAGCILFKNATTKRAYCRYFFKGYNFRAKASFFDWFLITVCMSSFIMMGVLGTIMYVINGFHMPTNF